MKNQCENKKPIKIIQLTDSHLFLNNDSEMFGVKPNEKFKQVLDVLIKEDILDTDFIFLTGDLSQDETKESYQKIVDALDLFNIPIYWIPGNHDDLEAMLEIFNKAKNFHSVKKFSILSWKFIFINTNLDSIAHSELKFLSQELKDTTQKNVIIMHHHPAEVNTPLIDQYILKNKNAFWEVLAGNSAELIMCGHVHGDYSFIFNDVMIESGPATCLQWQKGTSDLTIDKRIGYKIYYFDSAKYTAEAKQW